MDNTDSSRAHEDLHRPARPQRRAAKRVKGNPDSAFSYDVELKVADSNFLLQPDIIETFPDGTNLNIEYIQRSGFRKPIFVADSRGLGMRVPQPFDVQNVCDYLGSSRLIDVMDVSTQNGEQMTLGAFVQFYKKPPRDRRRLLNVLSLEFSQSEMDHLVSAPEIVRQIDWTDCVWPPHSKQLQKQETSTSSKMLYPKVQKYCLMSVAGCFTDFHVDLGGTSVWYNIVNGEKMFWLIPPKDEYFILFQEWTLSGYQHETFFGDIVPECYRIHLKAGNTFFIPSGWIHAVYTPTDSLVFGGNFLHSYAIPMQLNVYETETNIHVPAKFRFPFFLEILWYAAERYVFALTGQHFVYSEMEWSFGKAERRTVLSAWELDGLCLLYDWLSESITSKSRLPVNIREPRKLLSTLRDALKLHSVKEHSTADLSKTVLQPYSPDCLIGPAEIKEEAKVDLSLPTEQKPGQSINNAHRAPFKNKDAFEQLVLAADASHHADISCNSVPLPRSEASAVTVSSSSVNSVIFDYVALAPHLRLPAPTGQAGRFNNSLDYRNNPTASTIEVAEPQTSGCSQCPTTSCISSHNQSLPAVQTLMSPHTGSQQESMAPVANPSSCSPVPVPCQGYNQGPSLPQGTHSVTVARPAPASCSQIVTAHVQASIDSVACGSSFNPSVRRALSPHASLDA